MSTTSIRASETLLFSATISSAARWLSSQPIGAQRASPSKVIVYSNCDEIELSLNGSIIARQKPDSGPDSKYSDWDANIAATVGNHYDNTGGSPFDGGNAVHLDHPPFTFTGIDYVAGQLVAVGYINGVPVAQHDVRTPEMPHSLEIDFDTQHIELTADGADAVFVRVNILDANGTIVPVNELGGLDLAVSGPARLIGTEPIHVEAGVASVLLQTTGEPGIIIVSATCSGLTGATKSISSVSATGAVSRTPEVFAQTV